MVGDVDFCDEIVGVDLCKEFFELVCCDDSCCEIENSEEESVNKVGKDERC